MYQIFERNLSMASVKAYFIYSFILILFSWFGISESRADYFQLGAILKPPIQKIENVSDTLVSIIDTTPKNNAHLHIIFPNDHTLYNCKTQLLGLSDSGYVLLAVEKKCLNHHDMNKITTPSALELKLPSGYLSGSDLPASHAISPPHFTFSSLQWMSLHSGDLKIQKISENRILLQLSISEATPSATDAWLLQNYYLPSTLINLTSEESTQNTSSLWFCESASNSYQNHCLLHLNGDGCQCLDDYNNWEKAENPRLLLSGKIDDRYGIEFNDRILSILGLSPRNKIYCNCADNDALGVTTIKNIEYCRYPLPNGDTQNCKTHKIFSYQPVHDTDSTIPDKNFIQLTSSESYAEYVVKNIADVLQVASWAALFYVIFKGCFG